MGRFRSKFFWKLSDSAELTNDTTFTFSADRLAALSTADIEDRFREYTELSSFSPLEIDERLPQGPSVGA